MPSIETVRDWQGRTMLDNGGERVGRIQEIYLDMQTDEPEWALVNTGLFGLRSTFVPISDARESGDDVVVPFSKDQIKDAPGIEPDRELTEAEEDRLYSHYGVPPVGGRSEVTAEPAGRAGVVEGGQAGRRRLRRWLVTEQVTEARPGGRERIVVERTPLEDTDKAPGSPGH
jgi:sporulation protein YlmC with PRC-barrel domain